MTRRYPRVFPGLTLAGACALACSAWAQTTAPKQEVGRIPEHDPAVVQGQRGAPQAMDSEIPKQRLPKPYIAAPGAASMGPAIASKTLLILGGIGLAGSVPVSLVGLFALSIGCVESDKGSPEAAAHCGDTGRAWLYSALGLGIAGATMLVTGGVLQGLSKRHAMQQSQRGSGLRLVSPWPLKQPLRTSPAGGEQPGLPTSSGGLALALVLTQRQRQRCGLFSRDRLGLIERVPAGGSFDG